MNWILWKTPTAVIFKIVVVLTEYTLDVNSDVAEESDDRVSTHLKTLSKSLDQEGILY